MPSDPRDPAAPMPTEDAYAPTSEPRASAAAPADPVADLKKGLGLLFRAARTAAQKLPTERIEGAVRDASKEVERAAKAIPTAQIETAVKLGVAGVEAAVKKLPTERVTEVVRTGATEVGRAFESVAGAVERTVTGKPSVREVPPDDGDEGSAR